MSGPAAIVYQWLTEAYRGGRPLALLFDFDGTLVPLADHPSRARLGSAARDALTELSRSPNIFVGVISGRSLEDLKQAVGLPELYYSGSGGLELDLLGLQVVPPDVESGQQLLEETYRRLAPTVARAAGAWIEQKPLGLTVHYRDVPPGEAAGLRDELDAALDDDRLKVWRVNKAVEVIPAFGWSKATAVSKIVEDAARDALPFYAGDEANDVEALELVRDMGGLAVGVGERPPRPAQMALESPRALVQVLHKFAGQIAAGRLAPLVPAPE